MFKLEQGEFVRIISCAEARDILDDPHPSADDDRMLKYHLGICAKCRKYSTVVGVSKNAEA